MIDEFPKNEIDGADSRRRRLPAPLEAAGFAIQERLIWPLQDRFGELGGGGGRGALFDGRGPSRSTLLGGGAFAIFVAVLVVLTTSGGGNVPSGGATTSSAAPSPREPLIAAAPAQSDDPKPEAEETPRETLHGAAPVFSPPSPASKGGEKTGASRRAAGAGGLKASGADASAASNGGGADSTANGSDSTSTNSSEAAASGSSGSPSSESASTDSAVADPTGAQSEAAAPSPAAARISSDPDKPAGAGSGDGTAAARATVPNGPPAGPEALKVAREFAKGFVVYETGGEASAFRGAFAASATPELRKALLQRPPKQPAGMKVPRAKVLNVVAGPSQGRVYKVSVALLRVGVTSELRLDMERVKTAGKSGKSAEWRVTNVLG